jgi:hypothetical protein
MKRGGWSVLEKATATVETALSFPIILMVAIGLVQFAIYWHAQDVVTAAVQDGARVAASDGRTLTDGVNYAQTLLNAGLGPSAQGMQVKAIDGGDAVAVQAQGQLRLIIPWIADAKLPLGAQSIVSKEKFRAGPNG